MLMQNLSTYWSWATDGMEELFHKQLFAIDGRFVSVGHLLRALAVFLLVLVLSWIVRYLLRRLLGSSMAELDETSETTLKRLTLNVLRKTQRVVLFLLAAYLALITLPFPPALRSLLHSLAIIIATIQVALWANATIQELIESSMRRRAANDPSAASAFGLLGFFTRVAVWSAAVLLILTNLGYEIGPLLAGLGVGGVAVAIALQSILGDIFCSIAIVLDKPFVLGDFIIVGDMLGTVEHIGIKTTRVRSLSGEQIIFSNADLLSSRVRNYKRMYHRRVVFNFGIVYETPLDKVEQLPNAIRQIIEGVEQTQFDRAHFHEFADFSLNFEVVYYVQGADYNTYMDIQQQINLELFRHFQREKISFAYPTRELILRTNSEMRPVVASPSTPSSGSRDEPENPPAETAR